MSLNGGWQSRTGCEDEYISRRVWIGETDQVSVPGEW